MKYFETKMHDAVAYIMQDETGKVTEISFSELEPENIRVFHGPTTNNEFFELQALGVFTELTLSEFLERYNRDLVGRSLRTEIR